MKNYEIIENDEELKTKIQEQIEDLGLESLLKINHPAHEGTCALEVNYKIKAGDSEDSWFGDILRIYVNDDNPSAIHIYDSPWVSYSPNDNSGAFGTFQIKGTIIRLYSDKVLLRND